MGELTGYERLQAEMAAKRALDLPVDFELGTDQAAQILQDLALDFWRPETVAARYELTADQLRFWLARPAVKRALKEARSYYASGAGLKEKVQLNYLAGMERSAPGYFQRMNDPRTPSNEVAQLMREARQIALGDGRTGQQGAAANSFAVNISIGGMPHTSIVAPVQTVDVEGGVS